MKQFIVIAVSLPLMLLLLMEFVYNERQMSMLFCATDYVYSAREEAKQEGMFTEDIKDNLKKNLSRLYGSEESKIVIQSSAERKYRYAENSDDRYIEYKVIFPIGRLYIGSGVTKNSPEYSYVISGCAPSEYIK